MIKIAIAGIDGRMGQHLVEQIHASQHAVLVGGSNEKKNLQGLEFDLLIDFSVTKTLVDNLAAAKEQNAAYIIGVTGFTKAQIDLIKSASKTIAVMWETNFSLGMQSLFMCANILAQAIDGKVVVEETHHKHKLDAPSGSAISLADSAIQGNNRLHSDPDRVGQEVPEDYISFISHRRDEVIGEHSMRIIGTEEIVEIAHIATTRMAFAKGALFAGVWLADQQAGYYHFRQMLLEE